MARIIVSAFVVAVMLVSASCVEKDEAKPRDNELRSLYEKANAAGKLESLEQEFNRYSDTVLYRKWNDRAAFAGQEVSVAAGITTEPLTRDTGTYAETPVDTGPKDKGLYKIWKDAQDGGYSDKLDKAIEQHGGDELKRKWNDKR